MTHRVDQTIQRKALPNYQCLAPSPYFRPKCQFVKPDSKVFFLFFSLRILSFCGLSFFPPAAGSLACRSFLAKAALPMRSINFQFLFIDSLLIQRINILLKRNRPNKFIPWDAQFSAISPGPNRPDQRSYWQIIELWIRFYVKCCQKGTIPVKQQHPSFPLSLLGRGMGWGAIPFVMRFNAFVLITAINDYKNRCNRGSGSLSSSLDNQTDQID